MSGFNCTPSVVPPRAEVAEPIIAGDWFPDIDLATLRLELRLDSDTVAHERLRRAAIGALITVTNDLSAWQADQIAAGHASIDDVPGPSIDGTKRGVFLFHRAIGALVKAELTESARDFDLTGAGGRAADLLEPSIGDLRREARHAIRDILGRTRTAVELI